MTARRPATRLADRRAVVRQRGVAMLMLLIAVSVATVLSMSFLASQSTSTRVAENVNHHARARAIAESGLRIALRQLHADPDWRTNLSHGRWIDEQAFDGGTFTVWGHDGLDEDDDGVVDGDSDLADDPADPVTLTSRGTFAGVTHTVFAEVQPEVDNQQTILMIVRNEANLIAVDEAKRALFESWGYDVVVLQDDRSQSDYDAALVDADVVYISEPIGSWRVGDKLTDTAVGVVSEEGYLNDSLGLSSGNGPGCTGDRIDITDTSHYITSEFSTGSLTLCLTPQSLRRHTGSITPGAHVLGEQWLSSTPTLAVLERGAEMFNGDPAAGRRVFLPWGDNGFDVGLLTADGRTLLQRAIEWAADGGAPVSGLAMYGIAATGAIELTGNPTVDSFDSSQGAYGGGNRGSDAVVATTATDHHIVELKGSATVRGDVQVGPGADPDDAIKTKGGSKITGSESSLSEPYEITVTAPDIDQPATDPDLPHWGDVRFGTPGSDTTYHWTHFIAGGSLDVYIDGPVTALVDGDFRVTAGADLIIADGASLTLYLADTMEISGDAKVNVDSADPSRLQVYVLNGDAVDFSGSAEMYGTIVAPGSSAAFVGDADLYGLFHGEQVELKGSAGLHQDLHALHYFTGSGGSGSDDDGDVEYTYAVRWVERD